MEYLTLFLKKANEGIETFFKSVNDIIYHYEYFSTIKRLKNTKNPV